MCGLVVIIIYPGLEAYKGIGGMGVRVREGFRSLDPVGQLEQPTKSVSYTVSSARRIENHSLLSGLGKI